MNMMPATELTMFETSEGYFHESCDLRELDDGMRQVLLISRNVELR